MVAEFEVRYSVISVQSTTTTAASKSDTRITLRRWQLSVRWSGIRETSGADVASSTTWSRSPLFAKAIVLVVVPVVVVFVALVE